MMRNIRAQHEIELWFKKEPEADFTSVLESDFHLTSPTVKLPKVSSKLLQDGVILEEFIIRAEAQGDTWSLCVNF